MSGHSRGMSPDSAATRCRGVVGRVVGGVPDSAATGCRGGRRGGVPPAVRREVAARPDETCQPGPRLALIRLTGTGSLGLGPQ
jgi:hypothetical protein